MLIETNPDEIFKKTGRSSGNCAFAREMVNKFLDSTMLCARVEGWPNAVKPESKRMRLNTAIRNAGAADDVAVTVASENVYLVWMGETEE